MLGNNNIDVYEHMSLLTKSEYITNMRLWYAHVLSVKFWALSRNYEIADPSESFETQNLDGKIDMSDMSKSTRYTKLIFLDVSVPISSQELAIRSYV